MQQAMSNDGPTIGHWKDIWVRQMRANKARFGSFESHSAGVHWGKYQLKPCIVAGSGPSLKYSIEALKTKGDIPLVSCLHNFHFMEDNGIDVDFYVTLDSGPVTVPEVSEGGKRTPEEYWELTKTKKLIAYTATHPELLEKWQGEVYFFSAGVPDVELGKTFEEIENFRVDFSTGGNVLGAATYFAKAICGANPVIFIGADFCFEGGKFHSWDSAYDKDVGYCVYLFDVFGKKVATWQSYANFKAWFDNVCIRVPGIWINATEGGCLGAYADGNIMQIRQMDLADVIDMYTINRHVRANCLEGAKEKLVVF